MTRSTDAIDSSALSVATRWVLHFVVIWAKYEPNRIGESLRADRTQTFGRDAPRKPHEPQRAEFFRQRPGALEATGQLNSPTLSRRQWLVSGTEEDISIETIGKQRLLKNGVPVTRCTAKEGDVVSVEGVVSFLVERRPPGPLQFVKHSHGFGLPDKHGIVGEHPHTWDLRWVLEHVGASERHTLLLGDSGVGKELAACALHNASQRAKAPLVSRNAASIPAGLVEVELFGHAANYPNAGMPARPGLIGSADATNLFLDEIAELDELQQANLLRVLDAGEYHRLGEERRRTSDFRLIGATNRPVTSLKRDLLARFPERIEIPSLNERRGDIPFLINHLLIQSVHTSRVPSQALVERLTLHEYSANIRELGRYLLLAQREGRGESLPPPVELIKQARPMAQKREVTEQVLREALSTYPSVGATATALGLPSRYALYRLMKKWNIERPSDEDSTD